MAIEFPANKFVNDTFDYGGMTYVWDGEKWTASGAAAFEDAYVNISGDTMTGDLTVPSLNGGPLGGMRNQIINGDFRVWQRGTSFTLPSGANNNAYTADRWYTANGVQCRQFDDNAPAGFTNCWNHQGGAGNVGQLIEVDDTIGKQDRFANGTTWTMSVWSTADLTDGNHNFTAQWTESPLANTTQIATGAWTATGESSNGFNRYRFTFTINTAIGASQSVLHVFWVFPGESAWYTGAQLELGSVATPFEHRPIGTELALCQRYYIGRSSAYTFSGTAGVKTAVEYPLPTLMRADPTTVDFTTSAGTVHQMGARTFRGATTLFCTYTPATGTGIDLATANAAFDAEL